MNSRRYRRCRSAAWARLWSLRLLSLKRAEAHSRLDEGMGMKLLVLAAALTTLLFVGCTHTQKVVAGGAAGGVTGALVAGPVGAAVGAGAGAAAGSVAE